MNLSLPYESTQGIIVIILYLDLNFVMSELDYVLYIYS